MAISYSFAKSYNLIKELENIIWRFLRFLQNIEVNQIGL